MSSSPGWELDNSDKALPPPIHYVVRSMELEQQLREAVRVSLGKDVGCFIGYERGPERLSIRPYLVRESREANRLVWNPLCSHNLTAYLLERTVGDGKVGIVVKGCDARSVIELLKHNQLRRENLFVVGVACGGQVDPDKVEQVAGSLNLVAVEDWGGEFALVGTDGERRVRKEELLLGRCFTCKHPHSFQYDIVLGDMTPPPFSGDDSFEDVEEIETLPLRERAKYWEFHFSQCIRCFACRNVCPSCFCPECIFDRKAPRGASRAVGFSQNWLYHAVRAFHLAGRCTDCGECERACPVGIPLRRLQRKLQKDLSTLLGYDGAGLEGDVPAPLAAFDPNDPEPFG